MGVLIKSIPLVIAIFLGMDQESFAEELPALQVKALRADNGSENLQLLISWTSLLADTNKYKHGAGSLYHVMVQHLQSENCTINHQTPFYNEPRIRCAPIVTETEATSIHLPQEPNVLKKHECVILPYCTYHVDVQLMDTGQTVAKTDYQVPECVQDICSCHYALPNITSAAHVHGAQIVVNWTLEEHDPFGWPSDVELKYVDITLRRRGSLSLGWGGKDSSAKSVQLAPQIHGSYTFHVNDFPGDSSTFFVHVGMYDSRRCYVSADPYSVTYNETLANQPNSSHISEEFVSDSKTPQYLSLAAIAVCIIGGMVYGAVVYQRKRKAHRSGKNWREIYDRPGGDHPSSTAMQMEENRLYTDMDILAARERGDADMLEVPHAWLRIGREVGKGAFGRVFMASASKLPGCNGPLIVAVKQLKKCPKRMPEFEEFLDEIAMMKRVGRHPNIVTLLGCCTIKEPLTMIMEYIGCGDLLEYLRKIRAKHLARIAQFEASVNGSNCTTNNNNNNISQADTISLQRSISNHSNSTVFGPMLKYMDIRHSSSSNSSTSYITQPDTTLRPSLTGTMYTTLSGDNESENCKEPTSIEYVLDHKELHDFARQIACGMQHLEARQITHRDLAARNILIDERKTLKISDFGLSRTGIYVNPRNRKVPLRWLSIEAMRDNLYSSKSDVWAFGIVLWEIGTLGGYPYPTVGNHELLTYLRNGERLERPENCSTELYELMLNCWKADPDDRPSFSDILLSLKPDRRIYIDFNEIQPTYVFPPTSEQVGGGGGGGAPKPTTVTIGTTITSGSSSTSNSTTNDK